MRRLRFAGLVALCLSTSLCTLAGGQEPVAKKLDLAYVTDDFFAAVVIHPARLLKSPLAEALPITPWPQWLKERIGLELEQIDQAILLLPRPEKGVLYQAGGIVRFREKVVDKAFLTRLVSRLGVGELAEATHAGKTYWTAPGARDMAAHVADPKTLVFASEDCLKAMIDGSGPRGGIVERLRTVGADDDLAVVAEVEPLRKLLADLQAYVRGDSAVPLVFTTEIAARLKTASIAIRLTSEPQLRAEFEAPDEKSAALVEDLVRGASGALRVAAGSMPSLVKSRYDYEILERQRLRLTHAALADAANSMKVSRDARRVRIEAKAPGNFPKLVAALVAATWASESAIQLRRLGLSMHAFADVYGGALPAHASYSKEAKPLLSWRVHVLPFLEHDALYREFHLDEPWDSPHNKKLIQRMPATFASPGRSLGEGKTCYLVPVGSDMSYRPIFSEKPNRMEKGTPIGTSFGSVTDGLSNTIMIVEAGPGSAVIWTKPDDWQFDTKEPTEGLFGMRKGKVLVELADASARPIPISVDDETLRRLIGRDDGRVFETPQLPPDDEE